MTPAQQREHAAWMRFRRSQMLEEIRELIALLCWTPEFGWADRPHEKIGDMIARLEWLRESHSADVASISTAAPSSGQNTGGSATQLPSSPDSDTPMADGPTPMRSAKA